MANTTLPPTGTAFNPALSAFWDTGVGALRAEADVITPTFVLVDFPNGGLQAAKKAQKQQPRAFGNNEPNELLSNHKPRREPLSQLVRSCPQ